jgi:uncharacterized UPF0160 family protein
MGKNYTPQSIGIHDGTFHADEVTACGLLIVFGLADKNKIIRTRDPQKLKTCEFVCDVGGVYDIDQKLFDHHQADYKGDFSSAGMVLHYMKLKGILSADEYDVFNDGLVRGVDAHDNGKAPQEIGYCTFSHVIANFNPVSYETSHEEQNEAFQRALEFTIGHLARMLERHRYNVACKKVVLEAMSKYQTCLLFDHAIPWLESFFSLNGSQHSALFVIMPAGEHWKLRGIPPDNARRMQVRQPLPLEWAGLLEEDLKRVSGIPGAVFCHKGRFTSVWETKEDAIKAMKLVLEKNGIRNKDNF